MKDLVSGEQSRHRSVAVIDSEGQIAVRLLEWVTRADRQALLFIARSEGRAGRVARALRGLAPGTDILLLPGWDCFPYDRASPSRAIMGRRIATLRRLLDDSGTADRIVVTAVGAAMQRLPPRTALDGARLSLRLQEELRLAELERYLARVGYTRDERVDEPGEAAIRGEVIDIFPADAELPCRLDRADGRVAGMRRFDPLTQRSLDATSELHLDAASEAILPPSAERLPGAEHSLPLLYDAPLETIFDYVPAASVVLDAALDDRRAGLLEQIADGYRSSTQLRASAGPETNVPRPVAPESLYLEEAEWERWVQSRTVVAFEERDEPRRAVPCFAAAADPGDALTRFIAERLEAGDRVVLTAASERTLRQLSRALRSRPELKLDELPSWKAALEAPAGAVSVLRAELSQGFADDGVCVVADADVLGARQSEPTRTEGTAIASFDLELRLGDTVVHFDHGFGILRGIETVDSSGVPIDMVKLEYAGGDSLLVPASDIDRLWRYGGEASTVRLDRLGGESWPKRRAEAERQLAEASRALLAVARVRQACSSPALRAPRQAYARFVGRFPFSETPDQARAIAAVIRDLAAGRPMDRLVCGDVGFGKTEVALRAIATAVFSGRQVAVAVPTTVLARQHLVTFRRRFAGLGIRIELLSRMARGSEAREIKSGLADGTVNIVVGTHALTGRGIEFKDLSLLVIDEEQRFGVEQKKRLRRLAHSTHVLTLTATPIPRTIQAALTGLRELSIIATPPVRRQPIRTFVLPFDPVTVRAALMRERRRGGQSFVVCPRIGDLEPMARRLAELAPDLELVIAHGKLAADELDALMVRFAEGEGDILLSTNIIEAGLDIPGANTIVIWRANRFGLAQLHQLRGRVGRGRVRGVAYLLTDPEAKLSHGAEERLRQLETLEQLGSGFAISARDLDLRGPGDIFGEDQAGHVKLVGAELYQDMLARALAMARGERPAEEWTPEIGIGVPAGIPDAYVPEDEVRLNLYRRLARLRSETEIDAFAQELEDRFGPAPDATVHLLELGRLAGLCRRTGVATIEAGPQGVALTFRDSGSLPSVTSEPFERKGDRLILSRASEGAPERIEAARQALQLLRQRHGRLQGDLPQRFS